jgi:mono/diheme cytochrome c family protein
MATSSLTSPPTGRTRRWSPRRLGALALGALLVLLLAMQLVPYGRNHTNPPVVAEPAWDSPESRALFVRACADCHSNQTAWPWYSNIAPVSWLLAHDVEEGRAKFNVSMWGQQRNEGDEAAETVSEGEMPLKIYLPTHPEARLTPAEREQLIAGLTATFGGEGGGQSGGESYGEDD